MCIILVFQIAVKAIDVKLKEDIMGLVELLVILVVLGVAGWAIVTYIPMVQAIKSLIIVVLVIAAVIFTLSAFGIISHADTWRISK